MSGHKYSLLKIRHSASARITRKRIREILEQENQQPDQINRHREHIEDMEQVFQDMRERQSNFSQTLEDFESRTLHQVEQQTDAALQASQESLYDDMQALLNRIWQETDDILFQHQEQNQRDLESHKRDLLDIQDTQTDILEMNAANLDESQHLNTQLSEVRQDLNHALKDFSDRHAEILEDQQGLFDRVQDIIQAQESRQKFSDSKEEIVQKQIADTEKIRTYISINTHPEKFMPGQLHKNIQLLHRAQQNFANGFIDTAMVDAQNAYQNLSELRIELEKKQAEWDVLFLSISRQLNQLKSDCSTLHQIPFIDANGKEIGETIEVDYWSSRRLSRLETSIIKLQDKIQNNSEKLSTEELQIILQEEIPSLRTALNDACRLAVDEALNSQLRINIADIVIQALESQGFQLDTSDYLYNDQRKTFEAHVTNLAGDSIRIDVEPNRSENGTSRLHLFSEDAEQRTEHELQHRANEILKTLKNYGLEPGDLHIVPDEQQEQNPQVILPPQRKQRNHLSYNG